MAKASTSKATAEDQATEPAIDVAFAATAMGIPTGNFETKVAEFSREDRARIAEASQQCDKHGVRDAFRDAVNRR
jgi:hypothetical protein